MRKVIISALLIIIGLCVNAQNLFVGTYNIRYDAESDRSEGNGWNVRSKVLCDMMNFEDPDIFGVQEALINQVHDLKNQLNGYDYIGVGRDDGKEAGEFSAIFYKKDKLKKLANGNFWLSETPEKPGLGWDAACIRICTWGKFEEIGTKFKFYYFNLHMDHVGVVARREAAKLVIKRIKEIAGNKAPVILTGDFNVDQKDEIYKIFAESKILKDTYIAAKQRFAENGTYQGFKSDLYTESRIDHIFVSNEFEVNHYGILTNGYWSKNASTNSTKEANAPQQISFEHYTHRLPSDHYPVLAKIHFNTNRH